MKTDHFDLVVVGGTPAGIMSAIAAARLGAPVALVEYHDHIGGMSTSGLGKSDIENKAVISGLFKEFTLRVHQYYIDKYGEGSEDEKKCRVGYYYEPSVAEQVFMQMIEQESGITLLLGWQIEDAKTESQNLVEAVFKNRHTAEILTLKAQVFVDATYEGDLYAHAGAAYRLGRESKSEFGEPHAGKIFFDHDDHLFLPGSTGEGDDNLTAYTYRLCMTDDPDNSYVLKQPPPGYDRTIYLDYLKDLEAGRLGGPKVIREGHGYYPAHFNTILRVFSFAEIPNRKYDVNINPRAVAFPFPEENRNYVEADWEQRANIFQKHRELVLGLVYFAQNDPEVPADQRKMANAYHLALDEFVDNEHFPWQFYVREARRLKGKSTLSENDLNPEGSTERSTIFPDSIITGEFPIDSFPVTKERSVKDKVLEGYICLLPISPYQVPLSILLPEKINRLIVPVAASTTHVAYSTIRMEPQWMGLGQVAGTLAHLSLKMKGDTNAVPVPLLQKLLLDNNQVLTYFDDLDADDKAFQAAQFWGTKGFFKTYKAELREPLNANVLNQWMALFHQELETDEERPTIENGPVSISDFSQLVFQLRKKYNIEDTAELAPSDWLYHSREDNLPVLRGEACQAFFLLYFKKMEERYFLD
ncbi:MAG: hypothetical protein DHS20C18_26080 [Saprospiraceae bacterium]|nr:MAG: hypothetical protein DHS20C18_26080 [Saprospiraceae bacterium]